MIVRAWGLQYCQALKPIPHRHYISWSIAKPDQNRSPLENRSRACLFDVYASPMMIACVIGLGELGRWLLQLVCIPSSILPQWIHLRTTNPKWTAPGREMQRCQSCNCQVLIGIKTVLAELSHGSKPKSMGGCAVHLPMLQQDYAEAVSLGVNRT